MFAPWYYSTSMICWLPCFVYSYRITVKITNHSVLKVWVTYPLMPLLTPKVPHISFAIYMVLLPIWIASFFETLLHCHEFSLHSRNFGEFTATFVKSWRIWTHFWANEDGCKYRTNEMSSAAGQLTRSLDCNSSWSVRINLSSKISPFFIILSCWAVSWILDV